MTLAEQRRLNSPEASTPFREILRGFAEERAKAKPQPQRPQPLQQPKVIVIVRDISGSTMQMMLKGMTVLEKIDQSIMDLILANPHDMYWLVDFSTAATVPIQIAVNVELMFAEIPPARPNGITNTHLGLARASEVKSIGRVVLFTDGETSSTDLEINHALRKLQNIDLDVVGVSISVVDLNTAGLAEQKALPGHDLLGKLGNRIRTLTMYNRNELHFDGPFRTAESSAVDRNQLQFMGVPVHMPVPLFIRGLLEELARHNVDWGRGHIAFKTLVVEIGKNLTLVLFEYPESQFNPHRAYLDEIIASLVRVASDPEMTAEKIHAFARYGFGQAKRSLPIELANIDAHAKPKEVKLGQFASAVANLKANGTTMGQGSCLGVGIVNGAVVVVICNATQELAPNDSVGVYPRSASMGIAYFSLDPDHAQEARIGLREWYSTLFGYDQKDHPVIFHTCVIIAGLVAQGYGLFDPEIQELRKIARMQCAMEPMIASNKYSGLALWQMWAQGSTPRMIYTNPATHTSLATNRTLNRWQLEPRMWWALMMLMLGADCYAGQLPTFEHALIANGITSSDEFVAWIRTIHVIPASQPSQHIRVITVAPVLVSVISLDEFDPNEPLYRLNDHGQCKCKTHYSAEERDLLVNGAMKCPWCYYQPTLDDFVLVLPRLSPIQQIHAGLAEPRVMALPGHPLPVHAPHGHAPHGHAPHGHALHVPAEDHKDDDRKNEPEPKRLVVWLKGTVGVGKSTHAMAIKRWVEAHHGICLIISSDRWNKQGMGRQMMQEIQREFHEFDTHPNQYKVVVVDMCNESPPNPRKPIFALHRLATYTAINVYPNLQANPTTQQVADWFDWALTNVLARELHSMDTLYWLNPKSAGVGTCVTVWRKKTAGIVGQLGVKSVVLTRVDENAPIEQIRGQLDAGTQRHAAWLATQRIDEMVARIFA